jgi:hypothetical protein
MDSWDGRHDEQLNEEGESIRDIIKLPAGDTVKENSGRGRLKKR